MLPFMANEMAFMNSVVFGTSANRVTPRNFSSMPEPSKMTSTTSTKISVIPKTLSAHRILKDHDTEALTSNDSIQRRTRQEHARTRRTTPRRRVVAPLPAMARIHLRAGRPKPRGRPVLLVAERTHSGNRDGAREVVRGHVAGELERLDARILHRVVDALQDGGEARAVDNGRVRVRYATIAGRLSEC